MSNHTSQRRVRLRALNVATAIALSSFFAAPAMAAGRVDISGLQSATSYDQFIVKYAKGSSERTDVAVAKSALNRTVTIGGKPLTLGHLRRLAVGADVVKAGHKLDRAEAESLMREIASGPGIEYVEFDAVMQPMLTPNDTSYNSQWHYFEATGGLNLPAAWDKATGNGSVVAVLDTGITNHSDLNTNVIAGYDFISDPAVAVDGDGRDANPSDPGDYQNPPPGGPPGCGVRPPCYLPEANSSWHGTHVAGTIAAVTNNAKGVAGVAFNAKISPVRVLGRGGGNLSDIADGIIWASGGSVSGIPANANPAEVINMSLGGGGTCSPTFQTAIDGAVSRGTVVVAAAGNYDSDVANFQPASCNNVIAVAASDRQGNRASYSNFGTRIDVTAPGGETNFNPNNPNGVLSALNTGTTTPGSETYAFYEGTSMAAPHVAGVAALMQSVKTQTPAQIENQLKSTARVLPGSCPGGCGAGIVDANAAVSAVVAVPPPGSIVGLGGKCLDVVAGGISNGSGIQVWDCNGFSQQKWTLEEDSANLKGVPSGRVIDVIGAGTADGTQLQIWDGLGAGNNHQAWHFTNMNIVGIANKVVDAVNGGSTNGTPLQLWDTLGNAQQNWNYYPESRRILGIGNKCLDVTGGNTANGTPVQLWDCTGVAQQQWQLGPNGTFIGIGGKCLEAANGSSGNGTQIRIWDCNGLSHQSWRLRGEIRGIASGKCIADPSSGQTNGSRVGISPCQGASNQRWEFFSF